MLSISQICTSYSWIIFLAVSYIYMTRPSMVPCSTPQVVGNSVDVLPQTRTAFHVIVDFLFQTVFSNLAYMKHCLSVARILMEYKTPITSKFTRSKSCFWIPQRCLYFYFKSNFSSEVIYSHSIVFNKWIYLAHRNL